MSAEQRTPTSFMHTTDRDSYAGSPRRSTFTKDGVWGLITVMISSEQETLIGRVFEAYLTEHHHEDLFQLAASVNQATHYPVVVNAMTLFEANMEVADYFNAYPSDVLAIFDKVLHTTVMESAKRAAPKNNGGICTPHARITGLPVCPEMTRDTIPRCRDVGRFLSVTGTVIRTSVTKVLEYEREYMCTKCRHVFTVQADFSQFCTFAQVVTCPSPHACNSTKFSHLSGGSEPAVCKDYQEIKIQEQVQRLTVGSIPRSIVVILEDDLVDHCKSGDEVTVYGVICQRWKPFYDANRCDVELVLKANNIEVNNKEAAAAVLMKDVQKEFEDFWNIYRHNPIAGRNQILLSLCPQVFGMYLIKLAVAMVLAGGVQRIDSSGTKIRGECHMLLVGDPGTGKSQFLKYATKIMPRSVLTTGIGSTSAGLTVAAVKDGGDWHLEAGALVLSDGGLCCIDEFNSIKEHDRISIHEAMEQQSISVAKAGMVCKLSTRTSILAATNPKGHYDPSDPLSVNVALASPLLSRFDLVLILMDSRNPEWDHVISSFILEDRGVCAESFSLWTLEKMTAYFSVIKRLQPQMSEDANSILTRYYQLQRQSDGCSSSRTTIRMLESLSRLAEAHARLMYRENVTIEDAVMAVAVMECSMQGGALLGNVNALFTSFPVDPIQQYETQCQILLEGLNLRQPLQKEMDRLIRLKRNSSRSPPHTKNNHYQLEETNCIKKTLSHDIASDSKCDSLDWFNCISSTPVSESIASPIITSTQQQPNGNSKSSRSPGEQSNCHIPKGIKSNARKDTDYNKTSNFCRAVPSASKEVMQKDVSKNVEENLSLSQEEMKQSERNSPEQPKCVFLKVSKNLRDQRLNEPGGSGEGGQHGLRVQSRDSPFKTENDESHTSSLLSPGKNSSSNNMRQDLLVTGAGSKATDESKRIGTGIKTVSALAAAEGNACEEWRAKLSNFVFKPRKMCSSDLDAECNLSSRDLYNDTHSKVDTNVLCSEEKEVSQGPSESRIKESDDVEDMQQKNTNTGTEAKLCSFTGIRKKDPGQSTSGFIKSTVPSSALAEFSSICTAESSNTAQSVGEKTAATVKPNLRKRNYSAVESCTSNSEAKKSLLSPAYIREKTPNSGLLGRVLDRQPPACTELTSGQKPEPGTGSSTKWQEKLIDRTRSAGSVQTLHDGPTHSPRPVHMKRRCFELGPPLTNALSLFGSAELCNDVLDTDWDQEVSDKT